MYVVVCNHLTKFIEVSLYLEVVISMLAGGNVSSNRKSIVVLRCLCFWFFNSARNGRFHDCNLDILDKLLADNNVSVCSNMKYFFDLVAFKFQSIVSTIDHSGINIERIDLNIIVIFNEKEETIYIILLEFLVTWL